jgi:hypothetical protein
MLTEQVEEKRGVHIREKNDRSWDCA